MYPQIVKGFGRSLIGVAVAAAVVGAATGALAAGPGEGTTVRPGRPTWDTNWFQTAIYIKALEKLGYDVEKPKTLDNAPMFQAIAQGDLDFETGAWFPLHNTYYNKVKDQVSKVGYVVRKGALQGYLIDKKTADKYHITTLQDFKKKKIRELFDQNGDGKADLVACPPGWGCELTIKYQLDAYHLRKYIHPIKAKYAASMADALARYRQGKPIFFYTWTPNWTVGVLKPGKDVVWLEVDHPALPPDQKALEKYTSVSGVEGCVNNDDPCKMGWPANDIRVVANNEFLKKNPAAKKLFEVASIPLKDIFAQNAEMFKGQDSEKDIDRQADQWIKDHQKTFDNWIEEAKGAAM